MEAILPATLLDPQNKPVPTAQFKDHAFALYFSAHWCPPCRGFTPRLVKWYARFQQLHPDKKLVIVFISSDQSKSDFEHYRSEMNFHAVSFEDVSAYNSKLGREFGVRGIPTLIFFDSKGSIMTRDGRDVVSSDPDGNDYPWKAKTVWDHLAGPLIRSDKSTTNMSAIEGKHIAFYFSAHWCAPCRIFTPRLAEIYRALQAAGKPFEIIFVSHDGSEQDFHDYFQQMPWLAIPFGDKRIDFLKQYCGVWSIPTLALVDPQGNLVRTDLQRQILSDPTGIHFPWPAKPSKLRKFALMGVAGLALLWFLW